jgi:hypothetical protein
MKRSDTLMLRRVLRQGGRISDNIAPTIVQTLRRMIANDSHKGDHCQVEREALESQRRSVSIVASEAAQLADQQLPGLPLRKRMFARQTRQHGSGRARRADFGREQ